MEEVAHSKSVSTLFTKVSHHRKCGVWFVTQNLFSPSKETRTRFINAHYLIIFKNPRDNLAISTLARQMSLPSLVSIFKDITMTAPYTYILLDFRQETPDKIRIHTNITPSTYPPVVYIPK